MLSVKYYDRTQQGSQPTLRHTTFIFMSDAVYSAAVFSRAIASENAAECTASRVKMKVVCLKVGCDPCWVLFLLHMFLITKRGENQVRGIPRETPSRKNTLMTSCDMANCCCVRLDLPWNAIKEGTDTFTLTGEINTWTMS